jgi:hypothetical protein
MLRRIFRPKREKMARRWRRFRNLYASLNISRVIISRRVKWARHVAHMGDMRNSYRILVIKPEGKRLLGRPRHR